MTRLSWLLLDKDKRANVEDVWQTAHLVNIALDAFPNASNASIPPNDEVDLVLRGEKRVLPLPGQRYEEHLDTISQIVDEAIHRSRIAQEDANKAQLDRIAAACNKIMRNYSTEEINFPR